jgi:hypothetical protein
MNCARCSAWSPEYRATCPFCNHSFPVSLAIARSGVRLKAEWLTRKREVLEETEPPLTFVQRRARSVIEAHLGARCVLRETGVIAHCVLVGVTCEASLVSVCLVDLRTPGFASDSVVGDEPDPDLGLASGWESLSCSTVRISSYGWGIRFEPEYIAALERVASANRSAGFRDRFRALKDTEFALRLRTLPP